MQRDNDGEYRGYGECPHCEGRCGRYRDGQATVDRCEDCSAEWACQDGRREWRQHGKAGHR